MRRYVGLLAFAGALLSSTRTPIAAQGLRGLDTTRNNLAYPQAYAATPWHQLGRLKEVGHGPKLIVFVSGWGFGAEHFEDFAEQLGHEYTTLLVTLPGFGNTNAWAPVQDSIPYSQTPWMSRAADLVSAEIAARSKKQAIVIGHFIVGSHVAIEVARRHGEQVQGLVFIGAELSRMWPSRADSTGATPASPEERARTVEFGWVPRFFKFVTDSTWTANNYPPDVFSTDSTRGKSLWNEQSSVPLPTKIRYLSEFYATDFERRFEDVRVPVLVLQPGFTAKARQNPRLSYLGPFFYGSWSKSSGRKSTYLKEIKDAGVFLWLDQPSGVREALTNFLRNWR